MLAAPLSVHELRYYYTQKINICKEVFEKIIKKFYTALVAINTDCRNDYAQRRRVSFHLPAEGISLKKPHLQKASAVYGPPCRIRTCDPQNRNLILYPAELRAENILRE